MRLDISVLSKPGGREPNEDASGCWSSAGASFCILCDGAGGHGGGDVASKLAVRTMLAHFQATPDCSATAIESALRLAHDAILAEQATGARVSNMRATAVVLAIDAARATAVWGHLGDSRLYCFREGRIIARTKDHSVVQRMVDAGYLRDEDLRGAAERNRLFAALGQPENFEPVLGEPTLALIAGDVFLLCSDGFWEYVDDDLMLLALADAESPEGWLRRMEEHVVAQGGKGQDNYSALAVWCSKAAPSDGPSPPVAAATA